jgi:hypothetical protein
VRAARTSGDSDSIAALAGAFVGAAHGLAAWPADWVDRIEYAEQLGAVASGQVSSVPPPWDLVPVPVAATTDRSRAQLSTADRMRGL